MLEKYRFRKSIEENPVNFFAYHLALEKCCSCLFSDKVEAALNFRYCFFWRWKSKKGYFTVLTDRSFVNI